MSGVISEHVVKDAINVLTDAINTLKTGDIPYLAKLSQHTIHNASVFQDPYSTDIAIIIYALSKLLVNKPYLKKKFERLLIQAKYDLRDHKFEKLDKQLHYIFAQIQQIDEKADHAISHVISNARIKKGSSLYAHGLSIGQAAKKVGVTKWEMYGYIGKTNVNDRDKESISNMKKRLAYTRQMLSKGNSFIGVDAGPIITLTLNNLLFSLSQMKKHHQVRLVAPKGVYKELITQPLETKHHKLEAFQTIPILNDGTIIIHEELEIKPRAAELLDMANHCFYAWGHPIHIVDQGEMETVALLQLLNHKTLLVDERTLRYLIESPEKLQSLFERRLHTRVKVDQTALRKIKQEVQDIRPIRTAELVTCLFEDGIFNHLLTHELKNESKQLLEGLLWGLKNNGCAITEPEINAILKQII